MSKIASKIDATKLGERLRMERKRLKISQDEVAAKLGVHRLTVLKIERGQRGISTFEFSELAKLYDRSPAYFFRERDDPDENPGFRLSSAPHSTLNSIVFGAKIVRLALAAHQAGKVSGGWLNDFARELGMTVEQMFAVVGEEHTVEDAGSEVESFAWI